MGVDKGQTTQARLEITVTPDIRHERRMSIIKIKIELIQFK